MIYLDTPEESSHFPNNKGKSSTFKFQAVYWRCVVVFFETSLRFHRKNPSIKHVLFTNTIDIPEVDGMNLNEYFSKNEIEIVYLDNKYPLPNNYFSSFRNQFFEFSIIEHMASVMDEKDTFLLLDSDCIFAKGIESKFEMLESYCAITLDVGYQANANIHGITRKDMQVIFGELGLSISEPPMYSGGEFLLAKGNFIKAVAKDFPSLFSWLLERNERGLLKFNEEAHVLSYYYYKHNASMGSANSFVKRMWTNRNHYRNIKPGDEDLSIWHMPNEKPVGFHNSYALIKTGRDFREFSDEEYHEFLKSTFLKASNHPIVLLKYLRTLVKSLLS